jgi:hypothetical protein
MKFTAARTALVTMAGVALVAGALVASPASSAPSVSATASAAASVPEPDADPFFRPADGYESKAPGTVLKKREVTAAGLASQQIQVRSTDAKGNPVTVVSTVIVPPTPYPQGERPLLSYQPAIDSLGDQCNPSYTLQTNTEKEVALLGMGLANGWAVVVTDYQGPRDAFGVGQMEGRAVLDGVRGAKSLAEAGLAKSPVGLWGYSGGGLASGWAAELQPTYAPELKLTGVAAGGMPADLKAALNLMDGGPFSGLAIAGVMGATREYPELSALMNDAGRKLQQDSADMCVAELALTYTFKRISSFTTSKDPLNEPVAKQVLTANKMGSDNPAAPVYLYHSLFDELVPHGQAVTVKKQWCAQGTKVKFYTDLLSEHNILAVSGAPGAVAYLAARFNGIAAPSSC